VLALALSAAIEVTLQARAVAPGELVVLTIALPEHRDRLSVRAFDRAVQPFPIDERTWRVAAKMPVTDFAAATGLRVSDERFDTVGGWVLDLFGRVPHRGESLDAQGVRVTVEKMHRTRILEVLVRLPTVQGAGRPVPPAGAGASA